MFTLAHHGPDTFVGTGPRYPWGGLYGGQIVAQALRAASHSVDAAFAAHSMRAYFIRSGDHTEPIRYEVDRIRNGRSFTTRRVVARQANGAILNAECSFQRAEESASLHPIAPPRTPDAEHYENTSFSSHFDRRFVAPADLGGTPRDGIGRVVAWMRVVDEIASDPNEGRGSDGRSEVLDQCWLAYLSDDLPSDAVREARRSLGDVDGVDLQGISLDHTIWFHRRLRADRWHLFDVVCHHFVGARGLALGHVFAEDGSHVATFAQEVLMREPRL